MDMVVCSVVRWHGVFAWYIWCVDMGVVWYGLAWCGMVWCAVLVWEVSEEWMLAPDRTSRLLGRGCRMGVAPCGV